MSTQGKRTFRPALHFTPEKMWLNDPNGLVYENGRYHLFYQHYPNDTIWGPMHWGHAISTDLIKWKHLPIALYPDDLGYIFSGSAVYDKNNTSKLGSENIPPIVAMFTHHGKYEQQSIAYSLDGITFTKYKNNPVIPNTEIKDFRDPKVFWNPIKNCWGMVLAAGDRVHFFNSENLICWEKSGEFGPEGNYARGVWECPDLFPLETEDGTKWILLVSMGMPVEDRGSRTQYFIGQYDGNTFLSDHSFQQPEYIDDGFDSYAGVTYHNTEDRILIAWGINWQYADKTPTNDYCGMMTFPRKLSLVKTKQYGYRLVSKPVAWAEYITSKTLISSEDSLQSETFALHINGKDPFSMSFTNAEGQALTFGIDERNNIFIDRSKAGTVDFSDVFAREEYSTLSISRLQDGQYSIDILFDVCSFEMFVDGGLRNFSQVVYPDSPYNKITFTGNISVSYHEIIVE